MAFRSCKRLFAGGDGDGGRIQRCRGVRPQRAVPVPASHSGSSATAAQRAVLHGGPQGEQELHVRSAEVQLLPRPDGEQRVAAAQEVWSHGSGWLPLRALHVPQMSGWLQAGSSRKAGRWAMRTRDGVGQRSVGVDSSCRYSQDHVCGGAIMGIVWDSCGYPIVLFLSFPP